MVPSQTGHTWDTMVRQIAPSLDLSLIAATTEVATFPVNPAVQSALQGIQQVVKVKGIG